MTPIGHGLVEAMTDVAKQLARKHGLVRSDGVIVCWRCETRPALMPSLHCAQCLQAHRDWHAGGAARTVNTPALPAQKTYHADDDGREAYG